MIPIRESGDACTFAVRVQPRAKRDQISGVLGEALKIAISAPPVEGRANEACCNLLAKALHLPKSSVSIAAGLGSRHKQVRVAGVSAAELGARLAKLLGGAQI
jgi:uncharacterized protein (TIGR00251 family)